MSNIPKRIDQSLRHGRFAPALEAIPRMKAMAYSMGSFALGPDDLQKLSLVLWLGHKTNKYLLLYPLAVLVAPFVSATIIIRNDLFMNLLSFITFNFMYPLCANT
jgi:hypothetical protein